MCVIKYVCNKTRAYVCMLADTRWVHDVGTWSINMYRMHICRPREVHSWIGFWQQGVFSFACMHFDAKNNAILNVWVRMYVWVQIHCSVIVKEYACVHVCVYACTYIHTTVAYVHIYTCMYVSTCIHTHTHTQMCTHTYTHVHACIQTGMYGCIHVHSLIQLSRYIQPPTPPKKVEKLLAPNNNNLLCVCGGTYVCTHMRTWVYAHQESALCMMFTQACTWLRQPMHALRTVRRADGLQGMSTRTYTPHG